MHPAQRRLQTKPSSRKNIQLVSIFRLLSASPGSRKPPSSRESVCLPCNRESTNSAAVICKLSRLLVSLEGLGALRTLSSFSRGADHNSHYTKEHAIYR